MNALTDFPSTDPTALYRYRDCLYADDLLTAALAWVDFFTWLDRRGSGATAEQICREFGFAVRPVDTMLTLFLARGLLAKRGDAFVLTTVAAEHLVAASPWHLGPYYASLKDRPVVKDLLEVLRTGQPANWSGLKNLKDWHQSMETDSFAAQFTAAMDCRGVFLAQAAAKRIDFSGHSRLLDIAGGSGIYACSFVAHHPQLRATVLEKPPVDRIAAAAIASRGFSTSVSVAAGDMLADPLPSGHDAHLFSNVLHDWDVPVVKQLLAASAAALPSGGLLIIHDAFLNAEKSGPLHVAEYSVMLMHSTQGRCYGTGELASWLAESGFGSIQHHDTAAARGILTAVRL